MVSPEFFDLWKDAHVKVLCRSFSNHCPILLKVESFNFIPKPFRVFDKWIGNSDFNALISDSWNQTLPLSSPSFSSDILLKNKLKRLRLAIKSWSSEQVSAQNQAKETLLGRLLDWDVRAKNGLLSDVDITKREEWLMDLGHIYQLYQDDLRQKSRIKWAVVGDENSRFFHSILRNNYANFSIKGINVNGAWIESPDDIKQAALDQFLARFKEEDMVRPSFSSSRFRSLSSDVVVALESEFTMEELKDAVWNCDGSKSPGPDGFNFNFIKYYWEVLKTDFWNCMKHFEQIGSLANGCNASIVVLIPKKNDPLSFFDYLPISLIGCVYKVISKLLSSRLACVIDSVVGPNQSVFIEGRQILDGCLIDNEIIRMASLENQKLLLFKVTILEACIVGLYNGISLTLNGANISLLQYADDALFFSEWSRWNANNLIHILKCFELGSGLKVNLAKSRIIGVGFPIDVVEDVAVSLGCAHDSLPFIYLGLPVGRKMRLCEGWDTVLNQVRNRLSSWKAKSLSIGGRLTFIKSVLGSIHIFYLSLFKSPVKIIDALESLRCRVWEWMEDLLYFGRTLSVGMVLVLWISSRDYMPSILVKIALLKIVGSSIRELGVEIRIGVFPLEDSGKYNVKTLSSRIQLISLSDHIIGESHRRNSWIPRKVNICVWRASLNRLPTRANLASRGISLASTNCLFCDFKIEQVLNGVFQIALWVLWNWWNRAVYASGDSLAKILEEDVFPAIQRMSKTWISARLSISKRANWNKWISKPFELFY
ncbi:putative RNA-directed DNA polymerase, eukaryota, reverse transcriptase zinc-binding domain protein [Tanacetum coccineum]